MNLERLDKIEKIGFAFTITFTIFVVIFSLIGIIANISSH